MYLLGDKLKREIKLSKVELNHLNQDLKSKKNDDNDDVASLT